MRRIDDGPMKRKEDWRKSDMTRTAILLGLLVCLLLLSTGVQGSPAPAQGPKIEWNVNIGSVSEPVVAEGVVLLRSRDEMFALDATDGSESWRRGLDTWGPPRLTEGIIVVTEHNKEASLADYPTVVLDPSDGSESWRLDGYMAVDIANGVVYATEGEYSPKSAQVRALSGDDGTERWRVDLAPVDFETEPARIAFTEGVVVVSRTEEVPMGRPGSRGTDPGDVSSERTRIDVFDAEDGALIWEAERDDLDPMWHPTFADGVAYMTRSASSHQWAVDAWDLRTGVRVWTAEIEPGYHGKPHVGQGLVLIRDGGRVFAYDTDDGSAVWDLDGINGLLPLEGDHIFVGVEDILVAIMRDGTEAWRKSITTHSNPWGPYTNGRLVVYLDAPKSVTALDAGSGNIAWTAHPTEDPDDWRFVRPVFGGERLYLRTADWLYAIDGTIEDPRIAEGPPSKEGPMPGLFLFVVVASVWVIWAGRGRSQVREAGR